MKILDCVLQEIFAELVPGIFLGKFSYHSLITIDECVNLH